MQKPYLLHSFWSKGKWTFLENVVAEKPFWLKLKWSLWLSFLLCISVVLPSGICLSYINAQIVHFLQILELPGHPYYVGVQFHPEFKSRPGRPSAPFLGTVAAAYYFLEFINHRGQSMAESNLPAFCALHCFPICWVLFGWKLGKNGICREFSFALPPKEKGKGKSWLHPIWGMLWHCMASMINGQCKYYHQ